MIFNFWQIRFVLTPTSSSVIILYFLTLVICAIVFMDTCKRMEAHVVLRAVSWCRGWRGQILYVLRTNVIIWFFLIVSFRVNGIAVFFSLKALHFTLGIFWLP